MRSTQQIIERARQAGVTLEAIGTKLVFRPKEVPAELIEELRAHKAEIIAYLSVQVDNAASQDVATLLKWASEMAERGVVLPEPVRYVEAPLVEVTTARVSDEARRHLRVIAMARTMQQSGSWKSWTSEWWQERAAESLVALSALRQAVEQAKKDQDI